MTSFLEMLDAIAGHDNEVLVHIQTQMLTMTERISIRGYTFDERGAELNIEAKGNEGRAGVRIAGITDIWRSETRSGGAGYIIRFPGGRVEMAFNLF